MFFIFLFNINYHIKNIKNIKLKLFIRQVQFYKHFNCKLLNIEIISKIDYDKHIFY